MKAEYKKLGKYIQPVDVRNIDFKRSEFEMFKKMVEINVTRIGSQLTLLTFL